MGRTTEGRAGLKKSVYTELRRDIVHCEFPPGAILNELQLTGRYNVSRTPVREAVSQLETEGYLRVLPKKGIQVTDLTISDILQIFQARIEIEPVTLRMARPHLDISKLLEFRTRITDSELSLKEANALDMEMHLYLIDCCRNQYLISMMHKLFDDNMRAVISTGQNVVKIHNAIIEHTELLDSLIADRDITECASLMRKHIETCRLAALNYFHSEEYREHCSRTAQPAPEQ